MSLPTPIAHPQPGPILSVAADRADPARFRRHELAEIAAVFGLMGTMGSVATITGTGERITLSDD